MDPSNLILAGAPAAVVAIIGWSLRRALQRVDDLATGMVHLNTTLATVNGNLAVQAANSVAHEQLDTERFKAVNSSLEAQATIMNGRFEDMLRRLDAQHQSIVEGLRVTRELWERGRG